MYVQLTYKIPYLPGSDFFFNMLLVCVPRHSAVLTLCDPMDYSPPGSSVNGIFQERILEWVAISLDFPGGSDSKASVYNAGDPGSIPGSGRSAGEGNGDPLQYYCLENPMDRGTWYATVHGVAKSRTRLSDFIYLLTYLFRLVYVVPNNPWSVEWVKFDFCSFCSDTAFKR